MGPFTYLYSLRELKTNWNIYFSILQNWFVQPICWSNILLVTGVSEKLYTCPLNAAHFKYELLNVELALLYGNSLIKCMDFFSDYWHVPNIKDCSQHTIAMNFAQKHYLKTFFSNRKQIFETFRWCYYSGVTDIKGIGRFCLRVRIPIAIS